LASAEATGLQGRVSLVDDLQSFLGGFIADRTIEIWEMHPERTLGKRPALFDIKQAIDPEVRRKREEKIRRDYEDATRGH